MALGVAAALLNEQGRTNMTIYFKTIDDPNAADATQVNGINNSGEMVGSHRTGTDSFGFAWAHGTFTTLYGPAGSQQVSADGVNDAGQIVGSYQDANFGMHGYLYDNGTYTAIDDPKAPAKGLTGASGINDSQQVVGYYVDNNFVVHGFLRSNGAYTDIDVPGAISTNASGINNAGEIVGSFKDAMSVNHGFLYVNGNYVALDDPLATSGTFASGINSFGQIVGEYVDAGGRHGFVYGANGYTTVDEPNAASTTTVTGINDAGTLAGYYLNGITSHGFATGPFTTNDFNSDSSSDMLWRNSGGVLVDWSMNGSAIMSGSNVTYQGNALTPDASWSIAATSDFNGDGKADVLWRQNSGTLAMWQMDGSTVTSSNTVSYQGNALTPDASWSVAGTADFNGDGKADMLWRQSSGALAIWDMNCATVTSTGSVAFQGSALTPDASWNVAGVGDFDGDGKADVLWRQSSGALAMWDMNGATVTSSNTVTYQGNALTPDASWSVAGVGDFNGDGNADLLWRQGSTGTLAMWLMNGSNVSSSSAITYQGNQVTPDASWSIVEVGDFNGDGNTDLMWRQAGTGVLSEWLMSGSQIASTATPASGGNSVAPDASWSLQSRPTNFG